jgi:hypothetical protein
MRCSARLAYWPPAVWTCAPRWGGFTHIIAPFEGIGFDGASISGTGAYVIPPLRHKHGVFREWGKCQLAEAAIIELCPDIYAEINLSQLTERVCERVGKVDRATVRRALKALRDANRSPR